MGDGRRRGGRGGEAEDLVLRSVAAHADSLVRTARRFSLCPDDAQDAYQRTLEIFMAHADRLDPDSVAGWLHVVVKREAQAIRRARQRCVTSDDVDFDRYEARAAPTPDERLASFDRVGRAAEALQRLKPQEVRALWLKAQGHSYNEICALTGWSYTKVNRCLTEGRRSFLARYATIESGAECERWLPVLSALVDGEASPEQVMALRPHLRNCPGCRTTLKTLHDSAQPLAAVLPVPLAAAAGSEDQLAHLLTRAYETMFGGFHERAIHSFTKAQTAVEAASAGKLAAVAASAAAVAGGGYATAERTLPQRARDKPAKTVAQRPAVAPVAASALSAAAAPSPPPAIRKATPVRRRVPPVAEFAAPVRRTNAPAPEFAPIERQDPQLMRAAAATTTPSASTTPSGASPPARAPEFGGARPAPEFGG